MNIYDISKQAGVSIATVSRVLNNSEKVSDVTRQKVLDVIEKSSYTPNAFARSLGLNSMYTVGILCSDSSDVYQARAIYYLERELKENSYASMLCCTGQNLKEKQEYVNLMLSRNVDAILFIGSHFIENSPEGNQYILNAAEKIPVFILNGELKNHNIYSILCDDYLASLEITDMIFSRGSVNPVYLYRTLSYSSQRKIKGFTDSLEKHGLTSCESRIIPCPYSIPEICEYLKKLEQQGTAFDSVIAADDELATGAVKYALQNQLSIPLQFQIVGYNNSVLSECSTPEITTIDNRVEFMCITAVSLMMQVFQGKTPPSKTIFTGSIIEKKTTRPKT